VFVQALDIREDKTGDAAAHEGGAWEDVIVIHTGDDDSDTAEYSNTGVKSEGLCDDAFDMRHIKRMRKEPKRSGLEVEPLRAPINQREVVFHDDYVYSTVGVMSFAPRRS
jgi:hypothetical protein